MSDQIQPWPVLRRGSRGHPVPAPRALGVTADGVVGPVTWRALVSGMLSL
ncbi:MAG TPA: hypothetical protein VFW50_05445 [Streptosporangiaceae bacterium]|nr:hypothetical protein [Streptosporangiaceae bacterium]